MICRSVVRILTRSLVVSGRAYSHNCCCVQSHKQMVTIYSAPKHIIYGGDPQRKNQKVHALIDLKPEILNILNWIALCGFRVEK